MANTLETNLQPPASNNNSHSDLSKHTNLGLTGINLYSCYFHFSFSIQITFVILLTLSLNAPSPSRLSSHPYFPYLRLQSIYALSLSLSLSLSLPLTHWWPDFRQLTLAVILVDSWFSMIASPNSSHQGETGTSRHGPPIFGLERCRLVCLVRSSDHVDRLTAMFPPWHRTVV